MADTGINQKSIIWMIAGLAVVLAITYFRLHPDGVVNGAETSVECTDDQSCNGAQYHPGFTIGTCRDCIALRETGIPITEGIGEYVDFKLSTKLRRLAKINSNWRLTEVYPPTVRHLNFCHENGTCVDLGLYPEKRTSKNLSALCKDALRIGLTVTNEYSDPKLYSPESVCPESNIFETTTGGHLHVQ